MLSVDAQRRRFALSLAAGCVLPTALVRAIESVPAYPVRPLHLVVQFPPGGLTDVLGRLVADRLALRLGQAVVVENRSGGNGIIATEQVAKSAADGYTLLLTIPAPIGANLVLYRNLPYDPRTDLRMITDVAIPRMVMVASPAVPAADFRGLIAALSSAPPGRYAMGSFGQGTQAHQIQVYMSRRYGLDLLHVPYRGERPLLTDLLAGVVDMTVASVATLQPFIGAGKLQPIGVLGRKRAPALSAVSTFLEQGYSDAIYSLTGPISIMVRTGTAEAIVERLGSELQRVIAEPEVRERINEMGAEPVGNRPAEADAAYRALLPTVLELTRDTGVTLD